MDKAGLLGKKILQGKNEYKNGGIFYGIFLATKMKCCSTIKKHGVIDEQKTFRRFTDASDKLEREEYFKTFVGDKLIETVPLSWKKSFSMGVVIPHNLRNCNNVTKDLLCDGCDKLVTQNKENSAFLNEIKQQASEEIVHMLPWYETI